METPLTRGETIVNRDSFIADHVANCNAERAKKYDRKKGETALHTLAYSRRKCAKNIWRRMVRDGKVK